MEYFEAGDLSRYRESIRDENEIRTISQQIALGLEKMHALGIIHRDLKPQVGVECTPITLDLFTYPLMMVERLRRYPTTSMEG